MSPLLTLSSRDHVEKHCAVLLQGAGHPQGLFAGNLPDHLACRRIAHSDDDPTALLAHLELQFPSRCLQVRVDLLHRGLDLIMGRNGASPPLSPPARPRAPDCAPTLPANAR